MKHSKNLKDNIVNLKSLISYYEDIKSIEPRNPKDMEKVEFKKRYLKDKILTMCIDNKKVLGLFHGGRTKRT